MYASKRHSYGPAVMQARHRLAALDHNHHLNRPIKRKTNGAVQYVLFFLSNKEIWKFSFHRKEQLHRFVSYMIKHSKGYLGISWRKHQVLNYSYCLTMLLLATFFVQFWLSFTTLWADIILQLISVWFNDVMAAVLSVFLVVQCYSCNFPSIFSK